MAHPLELAEPNVIDEELTRNCITTVEEMSIAEDRKKEMKSETELHQVQVCCSHTPARTWLSRRYRAVLQTYSIRRRADLCCRSRTCNPNTRIHALSCSCSANWTSSKLISRCSVVFRRTHSLRLAQALSFSFQNILKIDNLNGLYALVKLQLDNNIIEKIENIEHLTNLEWLDLSFNNISKIEGLDSLLKLTDISLFNNRIEKLKGLDNLTDLNCLSIGNNQITDLLSCLQYLRSFGNLRILSMQGNPCARDPDYHTRVIAHLAQRSDQAKSVHLSGMHAQGASSARDTLLTSVHLRCGLHRLQAGRPGKGPAG